MALFQNAHDLANEYFHVYMKYSLILLTIKSLTLYSTVTCIKIIMFIII